MRPPGSGGPPSSFRSPLSGHLFDARTVVVSEALTTDVAGEITERLAVLAAESTDSITLLMSNVPGGDAEGGLSTYDLLRSLRAPVTALASGRIAGPGILALVGVPADARFALPHARFRLREPTDSLGWGPSANLKEKEAAAADRRERLVAILAGATGQTEAQIEADVSAQRAFQPEEAVEYGLIHRVVQGRRDIE